MRVTSYRMMMTDDKHPYLIKEANYEYNIQTMLNSPEKISGLLNTVFHLQDCCEEYVYLICFDNRYRPTGVFELSHGTADMSVVGIRELYQRVLLSGAVSFVIAHNHPSGNTEPSEEDKDIFRKINDAGRIMGVPQTDFIIVGRDGYLSFRDHGYYQ